MIVDVNVAVSGANEVDALSRAVEAVQKAVTVPLCLDSGDPEALAAALRVCDGKVIINSVDGNAEKLDAILPLAPARVRRHRADHGSHVGHPQDRRAKGGDRAAHP